MADEGKRGIQGELFHAETSREPGDKNWQGFGFDINPPVFLIAGGLIILFIVLSLAFPDQAGSVYQDTRVAVSDYFDWLFILAANVFIIFMVYLAISKYGVIRLGGVDGEKEFSDISWIAMLFSAGMGIGLMFFGVAEPVFHLFDPHLGAEAGTEGAGEVALAVSLFHWGFHPWAIYALVALGLAFFSFNRGLPLTFRSVFYPVLGDRIYGWPGHVIDIFTIFATLFGLVTSLGLGALQINAGLTFVGDEVGAFPAVPDSIWVVVAIIGVVTGMAIISVYLGLDKGIRRLSNLNLTLMLVLLGSVFVLGPTLFILGAFPQAIGGYLGNFFELSFFGNTFDNHYFQGSEFYGPGGEGEGNFLVDWTVFYWAWWISWSPFVGMFIARISKGRSIREFVGGVLLIPVIFSFAWFSAMGGSALNFELSEATEGAISGPVFEVGEEVAMFAMFELMPGTVILSMLAIVLVTTFFVTSTDSGSLVLEHLSTGGKHETPPAGRVFWAALEGLVAATLLIAGGDAAVEALQAAAIASGLPFTLILLFMMYAVLTGLRREYRTLQSDEFAELIDDLEEEDEIVVTSQTGDLVTHVKTRDGTIVDVGDD